ncbi:rhodanese-related sulfurtransferase [Synechococcus sp. PCC 7336]|uniref:oxygen-dependent tRNA uridine(34) hydroxylase TrhO n=1 Tax=Synechococcus sp. PCC 7336 TaxID=195250 RepID=UPI00034A6CDF|nr:rhodanese-related sulfurtransferase [Synechococcus sp. PCC 7336]
MSSSLPQPQKKSIVVASAYKFVQLDNCEQMRDRLLQFCQSQGLKGTLLLASEGINGTVAGPQTSVDNLLQFFRDDPRFSDLNPKLSRADEAPFHRMKVKVKAEIVTMGVEAIDPSRQTGVHVDPQDWNALIRDPEVLTIDTRNQYEYAIGTFQNAIPSCSDNFHEFPQFVSENLDPRQHRKIAMFCTGGIRCEKASAYLLERGFEEVYQLNGGILNYLEEQSAENSFWEGECFVFDARVAVTDKLEPGSHIMCYACRRPLSERDCQSEQYQPGVACPYCCDRLSESQRASFVERWRQAQIAESRKQKHVGALMPDRQPLAKPISGDVLKGRAPD